MARISAIVLLVLSLSSSPLFAQEYRVMFYNTENFFDTKDDFDTDDDEFLPVGAYHWTQAKFEQKRNDLCRTIEEAGGGHAFVLIGLCEVENRYVLQQLITQTPLSKHGYAILHSDSPDPRGIDVALLYVPSQFRLLDSAFIRSDTDTLAKSTRDILYAKGVLGKTDTLHVFVNHWPSKREGDKASEPYRMQAARILRSKTDSLLTCNSKVSIIVMGDFNDTPNSKPIQELLGTNDDRDFAHINSLYSMAATLANKGEGTSKYKGKWQLVDMMFCSAALLSNHSPLGCSPTYFSIFKSDFMLEPDKTYGGSKPKRTLLGPRYNGGVSDHLPVVLRLHRQ